LRLGRLDIQGETRFFNGPGSVVAERANLGAVLLELRVVVKETSHTAGSKETNDIVFTLIKDFPDVVADRPVHEGGDKSAIVRLEPVDDLIVLLVLRTGIKELLVFLVLVDDIEHALVQPVSAIEYLTFAIKDKFLEVQGDRLGDTEILRVLGNADLHLLADAEEVIDRIPAREDNGGELGNVDFLFAEILTRNRFKTNERIKRQLHVVLFG